MRYRDKLYYEGWDAICERCGATFKRFLGMNDGGMCAECFRRALAVYMKHLKDKHQQASAELKS